MDLADRLREIYGCNEPILLDEIKLVMDGYSVPYIFQCIRKAVREGKLSRFDESVYYIPTEGILGRSTLSTSKVLEKKYLSDGGKVVGFYSGIGLLNAIGGTRQMPFVYEIITNKESSRKREVMLGRSRIILRRPRCEVSGDNKVILQILELCNHYLWNEEAAEAVLNYAKANNVLMRNIMIYAKYYPAKAIKNASGVLYGIA